MPVKSYLAIPKTGRKERLQQDISQLMSCEVIPSENKNVLLLLTETSNEEEDKSLFKKINNFEDLQLLTLVSAFANNAEPTLK